MDPFLPQRARKIVMYILGGFLALGAYLESVDSAISLLTPLVASIGTACIVLVWCLVHFILPSHHLSWVFGMQRMPVKKPGIQPTAIAVGMVLLLWMPSILPSPDKGIEVEKLDTIQKNTENTQQNVQKIVALLEQELSIKTAYIIFLQGQVERFQAQEPSPRAQELAAQIPSDANPYALALKAIAERRFDDARRLLGEAQHAKEVELVQIYEARAKTEMYDGRYGDAVGWYERALALNPDDPRLLNGIGFALISTGNYAKAETPLRQALVLREKTLGSEHLDVAASLNNLAEIYRTQGRYTDAEPRFQRALAIREKVHGPEHPLVAASLYNLAQLYRIQGRYADAEPRYQRALAIQEKVHGPEHSDVATILYNLAQLYRAQGRYTDAEPRYQRALAVWEKVHGPEHPLVATAGKNYAALLRATNRDAEAEQLEARWQVRQPPRAY